MKMRRLVPWFCAVYLSWAALYGPALAHTTCFLSTFLVAAVSSTPGGPGCLFWLALRAWASSMPHQDRFGDWLINGLTHRQRWYALWTFLAACCFPAVASAILKTHLAPVMSLPNVITLLVSWSSVVGVVVWGACHVTHLQAYVLEKKVEWAGRMIDG